MQSFSSPKNNNLMQYFSAKKKKKILYKHYLLTNYNSPDKKGYMEFKSFEQSYL